MVIGAHYTPRRIGRDVKHTRQTVNAIETEKYDPSLPLAFKIARLFGQAIEDIFTDGDVSGA